MNIRLIAVLLAGLMAFSGCKEGVNSSAMKLTPETVIAVPDKKVNSEVKKSALELSKWLRKATESKSGFEVL
ncbi:MAG: hypothetical protein ACYTFY_12410, partial [Planctomycetota bacterium]